MRPLSTPIVIPLCLVLFTFALGVPAAASAEEPSWLCIPTKAGAPVTSGGGKGECEGGATAVEVPPPTQMKALGQILPHISYVAEGVGNKPTIQFSGVNVQVVNGEGKTESSNGEGNLIIGYAEGSKTHRTGSHNLVLGLRPEYTSYGGIVAGEDGRIAGPFASVLGGLGGVAGGRASVVVGGDINSAEGELSVALGGVANSASGSEATVSGGSSNRSNGHLSWVGGGGSNLAEGLYSSIFGGKELTANKEYEAIP